jgi:hypothetical protein
MELEQMAESVVKVLKRIPSKPKNCSDKHLVALQSQSNNNIPSIVQKTYHDSDSK